MLVVLIEDFVSYNTSNGLVSLKNSTRSSLFSDLIDVNTLNMFFCLNPALHVAFCPLNMTLGKCDLRVRSVRAVQAFLWVRILALPCIALNLLPFRLGTASSH
jgi:hypothetical protein